MVLLFMNMKTYSVLFLILILPICGCWTIGQKSVPHGVSKERTKEYVETTQELYSQNEYLTNNKDVIAEVFKKEPPIIPYEKIKQHEYITTELVDNAGFNYRFSGKLIKDTGLDLTKPITLLTIFGVIAAIIIFPQILYILVKGISGTRRALKGIVDTIEVSSEHETISDLKHRLSKQLNRPEKVLISKTKS